LQKLSLEKAKKHLEKFGLSDRIRIAEESTATVALAAKAFDCEEKKIAKTLSFMLPSGPILVLAVGDARIDNAKFKHTFAAKAKMIKPEECEQIIGHAPGGVCPFGINEDVKVYLDESLKSMDSVLPACGTSDTGIELAIPELEKSSCCTGWVDITKTLD
jgi:prolyl-tRNA editing enzyme YbaK/EbsC (Cys-tRNA(Pro) deacylase)